MGDEGTTWDRVAGALAWLAPASMAPWALWAVRQSFAGNVGDVGLGALIVVLGLASVAVSLVLAVASLVCLAVASRDGADLASRTRLRTFAGLWIAFALVVVPFALLR